MNISFSIQYNLKDLNFFSSYYFLFHRGLGFNEALLDSAEITELCKNGASIQWSFRAFSKTSKFI